MHKSWFGLKILARRILESNFSKGTELSNQYQYHDHKKKKYAYELNPMHMNMYVCISHHIMKSDTYSRIDSSSEMPGENNKL